MHKRLQPRYRRFAGIMLDVIFDHFLSRHWQSFHDDSLENFSHAVFLIFHQAELSGEARRQAINLSRYNVFVNYQHWATVEAALESISQRIKRANPMADAVPELLSHYDDLERVLIDFYPLLEAYVIEQREQLLINRG